VVVHNTVFSGWADFRAVELRGRANLVDVSFAGGTNLLHVLVDGSRRLLGREIRFSGCQFRAADVPAGLGAAQFGLTPPIEGDLGGAEG
jgi:hypothetical protein